MPDALIVSERKCLRRKKNRRYVDYKKVVHMLERRGLIKVIKILGKRVWGRYYLDNQAIRIAYYKKHRNTK